MNAFSETNTIISALHYAHMEKNTYKWMTLTCYYCKLYKALLFALSAIDKTAINPHKAIFFTRISVYSIYILQMCAT